VGEKKALKKKGRRRGGGEEEVGEGGEGKGGRKKKRGGGCHRVSLWVRLKKRKKGLCDEKTLKEKRVGVPCVLDQCCGGGKSPAVPSRGKGGDEVRDSWKEKRVGGLPVGAIQRDSCEKKKKKN